MREVNSPETYLARPQEGFTDRVVVGPHEIVIDSDVLKLRGVPIRSKNFSESADGYNYVRVYCALGTVQSIQKSSSLIRVEPHYVSSH